jgi:hypothetical protein
LVLLFVGFLHFLAPAGRVAELGKFVEVTANFSGEVIEFAVWPNQLLEAATVLLKIDRYPAPRRREPSRRTSNFSKPASRKWLNCRLLAQDGRLTSKSARLRSSSCKRNSTKAKYDLNHQVV